MNLPSFVAVKYLHFFKQTFVFNLHSSNIQNEPSNLSPQFIWNEMFKKMNFRYYNRPQIDKLQTGQILDKQTQDMTKLRQTNTRHDKPQTDKHQTQQSIDRQTKDTTNLTYITPIKQDITSVYVMSYVNCVKGFLCLMLLVFKVCFVYCFYVQGLLCVVFVCLGFVIVLNFLLRCF